MPTAHPHRDVADRLRFFLESVGLSREAFVRAVDGAIGARSLYAVLAGARRPSRALAVLIERTWGFRADYLLSGQGAVWTEAQPIGPGVLAVELSPSESEVIGFMRGSAEDARTLVSELEQATAWSRLFRRALGLARELDAWASREDAEARRLYPLLVRSVYRELRFLAAQHRLLLQLRQRRRVHKLTDAFLRHFLGDRLRETPEAAEDGGVQRRLRPLFERRRRERDELERAIEQTLQTIGNLCRLGSLEDRVRALPDESGETPRRAALEGLAERVGGPLQLRMQALLRQGLRDPETRLEAWLDELLLEGDGDAPPIDAHSTEELRARFERLLAHRQG